MVKITVSKIGDTLRLKLEGMLAGLWVGLLEETWRREASAAAQNTIVDVSDVTFVDAEGQRFLTKMDRQGICFQATGCLIPMLLEKTRWQCQSAVGKPQDSI